MLYPYAPRRGQLDALFQLIFNRGDLILIAITSFGKSMIPQALSILMDRSVTIVILPLIQIGIEQSEAITRLGGHPLFIEKNTDRTGLLMNIKKEAYTHLLLSPELAANEQIRYIFEESESNKRVIAVVIDEAHLVHHWGDAFWPEYAQVGRLRIILGPHIPWFTCSATLDPHTLRVLKERGRFKTNTVIHRTPIDRSELLYRVGVIPRLQRATFTVLRFLFDPDPLERTRAHIEPHEFSKTIVFFDSKREVFSALDCMVDDLYSDTHDLDKAYITSEMRKPGTESSIRVVFATEALGIGVNLPDIQRSVLYGLPKNLLPATLLQRGGRACRDQHDDKIILLVDVWIIGDREDASKHTEVAIGSSQLDNDLEEDIEDESDENQPLTQSTAAERERQAKLPHLWYDICSHRQCIRRVPMRHFDEPPEHRSSVNSQRCCSYCNPIFRLDDYMDNAKYYTYKERGFRANKIHKAIMADIKNWATTQAANLPRNFTFIPTADFFLAETLYESIARLTDLLCTQEQLKSSIGSWRYWESH
ncbi:conserved hypothetical protein [Talaromyces stipitatus ATCC 10500]|uniref:DNA 3'-5' helicase n=1 Tax=Talaromyces stipitatus (strain ATCC 10500 / CBS 375.48 / QM 6759 / NRRL 1006) TaxID=441959 RepID=B8M5B1_TALSN|nr:uncharacterized protein TSTA_029880 [Talaromyces stipitatus ATCC 10500]EED19717.1 conserved hypothetical protein [Talaromyces stipitatus ATCC 10500]